MINTPRLFKHRNNADVAIEILKRFYIKEKQAWSMRVRWWRIRRGVPVYSLNVEQRLRLTVEQWCEWEVMT